MIFGAHMSTSGGFHRAIERGRVAGCEAVQIFVKNNMRWSGSPPKQQDVQAFRAELAKKDIRAVFGHTGYLINIAAPEGPNRNNSLKSLIQEIEYAAMLDLPFLVLHPGAHVGSGEAVGLKRAADGLNEVFRATKGLKVRIALENTAGQGSCLGSRFEHLAAIYDQVANPERLAVCIDTAHLFAAGFDIRTKAGWDGTVKQISKLIGLRQIVAFHLNDSKTALGSKVDRHEDIGKGQIGAEGFQNIVRDPRFAKHPGCLETHKSEDLHEDIANLATLRMLAGALQTKAKHGRARGSSPAHRKSARTRGAGR
jgi:deoxyribonuclease-4